MNEIERAIELLEEISYNMGLERDAEYAGDAEKFHSLCDKKSLIDLATDLCRAELSRQENAPLTWDEVVASEGKPVFIYGLEGEHSDDGWSIVGEKYERSGFTFVNLHDKNITNCGLDDLYGQTWLAYRYEPKGEKPCLK